MQVFLNAKCSIIPEDSKLHGRVGRARSDVISDYFAFIILFYRSVWDKYLETNCMCHKMSWFICPTYEVTVCDQISTLVNSFKIRTLVLASNRSTAE